MRQRTSPLSLRKTLPWLAGAAVVALLVYSAFPSLGGEPPEFRNQRYVRSVASQASGAFDRAEFERAGAGYLTQLMKPLLASGTGYDINDQEIHLQVRGRTLYAWSNGPNKIDDGMQGDDVVASEELID